MADDLHSGASIEELKELKEEELKKHKLLEEIIQIRSSRVNAKSNFRREIWKSVFLILIPVLATMLSTLFLRQYDANQADKNRKELESQRVKDLMVDQIIKLDAQYTSEVDLGKRERIAEGILQIENYYSIGIIDSFKLKYNTIYLAMMRSRSRQDSIEKKLAVAGSLSPAQKIELDKKDKADFGKTFLAATAKPDTAKDPKIRNIELQTQAISSAIFNEVHSLDTAMRVDWFKETYFLDYDFMSVTLEKLDVKTNQITVSILDRNDQAITGSPFTIALGQSITIPIEGRSYLYTFYKIGKAGRNPFTPAAYVTLKEI